MGNGEQAPAKKGLPVWAWIGIGCGALIVFVMIAVTIGGYFLANKAKDFAAELEENPARTIARGIIMANPELEEVSADDENGTITIRNTKTGELITVNYDEIAEGKLSFTTEKGEFTVDASEAKDRGSIKVTDDEGAVVFSAGGSVANDIPPWVPLFPGTEASSPHTMRSNDELSGGFELETDAPVATVLEFYRSALEDAGYEVSVNTYTQDDSEGGMVNGSQKAEGRNLVVILNSEGGGPAKAVISYSQR